jgi:hypothetical protein
MTTIEERVKIAHRFARRKNAGRKQYEMDLINMNDDDEMVVEMVASYGFSSFLYYGVNLTRALFAFK